MQKISGVVPAIGTPLTPDERVDEAGLRRLARYQVNAGVHGFLVNGSMGGFAYLEADEQIRAIETVVAEVNGRVPVIGGLGEMGTVRAIRMAKRIAASGASHLSMLPPYYFHASQPQLIAYFSDIAAAVDLPLFVYDNPAMTKSKIQPATIAELRRRIPKLVGMKESDQDCINLQQVLHLMRDDGGFSVLTGSEFLFHAGLQLGCDGGVGGLYNLAPHAAVRLYDAFVAGDQGRAAQLQRELVEAWQVFASGGIWGGYDEALRYLGICETAAGAPYRTALTEEERGRVRAIVDRYIKPYLT